MTSIGLAIDNKIAKQGFTLGKSHSMIGHLTKFIDGAVITSCSAIDNLKDLNFAIVEKMLKIGQTKTMC